MKTITSLEGRKREGREDVSSHPSRSLFGAVQSVVDCGETAEGSRARVKAQVKARISPIVLTRMYATLAGWVPKVPSGKHGRYASAKSGETKQTVALLFQGDGVEIMLHPSQQLGEVVNLLGDEDARVVASFLLPPLVDVFEVGRVERVDRTRLSLRIFSLCGIGYPLVAPANVQAAHRVVALSAHLYAQMVCNHFIGEQKDTPPGDHRAERTASVRLLRSMSSSTRTGFWT